MAKIRDRSGRLRSSRNGNAAARFYQEKNPDWFADGYKISEAEWALYLGNAGRSWAVEEGVCLVLGFSPVRFREAVEGNDKPVQLKADANRHRVLLDHVKRLLDTGVAPATGRDGTYFLRGLDFLRIVIGTCLSRGNPCIDQRLLRFLDTNGKTWAAPSTEQRPGVPDSEEATVATWWIDDVKGRIVIATTTSGTPDGQCAFLLQSKMGQFLALICSSPNLSVSMREVILNVYREGIEHQTQEAGDRIKIYRAALQLCRDVREKLRKAGIPEAILEPFSGKTYDESARLRVARRIHREPLKERGREIPIADADQYPAS